MKPLFRDLPFTNRLPELEHYEQLLEGRGVRGSLLIGSPGLGKSTILKEVTSKAWSTGFLVLKSIASPDHQQRDLATLKQLVQDIPADLTAAYESRGLREYHYWLSSLLSDSENLTDNLVSLLPSPLDKLGTVGKILSQLSEPNPELYLGFQQDQAILEYIRYLCESGPVLLVIDDIHCADSSSISVIENLIKTSTHADLCLILAARSLELSLNPSTEHLPAKLEQYVDLSTWRLEPLSNSAIELSLGKAAPDLMPEVIFGITQQAEGNPLLAAEDLALTTLKAERNYGQNTFETSPTASEFTDNTNYLQRMKAIVSSRMKHLSPAALQCLEIGSCVGQTFTLTTVSRALGVLAEDFGFKPTEATTRLDIFELPQVIEELDQTGFLRRSAILQGRLEFRHPLLHEAVYGTVRPTKKSQIHYCVARHLAATTTSQDLDGQAQLARHFKSSKQWYQAFQALLRASALALKKQNYLLAVKHTAEVRDCLTRGEEDPTFPPHIRENEAILWALRLRENRALFQAGEFESALEGGKALSEDLSDSSFEILYGESMYWWAKSEYFCGNDNVALKLYARALVIFQSKGSQVKHARTLNDQAASFHQIGDTAGAEASYRRSLRECELIRKVAPPAYLKIVQNAGMVLSAKKAAPLLEAGIEVARAQRLNRQLGMLLQNYGVITYYLGRLEKSESIFYEARKMFLKTMSFDIVYALNSLGVIHLLSGNIEQAQRLFHQGEKRIIANFDRIWLTNNLAILDAVRGKPKRGIERLQPLLPLIEDHSDPVIRENSYYNYGVLLSRVSDHTRAITFLKKSFRRDTLYSKKLSYGKRYRQLALCYKALGEFGRSRRYLTLSRMLLNSEAPEAWLFRDLDYIPCHLCCYH